MTNLELKIKNFLDEINTDTLQILKIGKLLPSFLKNFIVYEITKDIYLEKKISEEEIKRFYLKNDINNKENLKYLLIANGLTEKELHYQITLPSKINKFAEKNFKNELNQYFLNQKEFLDEYTFNIIRVKKSDLAHELYFQLDSEESDFYKLSKRFSFYSSLYPDGIFGPRNLRGVNSILQNKLINASEGNLIMPFQVDDFWLIIKLIKRNRVKLEKQTKKTLLLEIFDDYVTKMTQNLLKDYFRLS